LKNAIRITLTVAIIIASLTVLAGTHEQKWLVGACGFFAAILFNITEV
jgi:hypothetical protein